MTIWYWFSLPWGTGALIVRDGIVRDGAPIFRKFRGQKLDEIARRYGTVLQYERLGTTTGGGLT